MEELDPMNGWYFCPFQQRQVTEPYQIVLVQSLILSIIKTKQKLNNNNNQIHSLDSDFPGNYSVPVLIYY